MKRQFGLFLELSQLEVINELVELLVVTSVDLLKTLK